MNYCSSTRYFLTCPAFLVLGYLLSILKKFLTGHENQEKNVQKLAGIENSMCEITLKKEKACKNNRFS